MPAITGIKTHRKKRTAGAAKAAPRKKQPTRQPLEEARNRANNQLQRQQQQQLVCLSTQTRGYRREVGQSMNDLKLQYENRPQELTPATLGMKLGELVKSVAVTHEHKVEALTALLSQAGYALTDDHGLVVKQDEETALVTPARAMRRAPLAEPTNTEIAPRVDYDPYIFYCSKCIQLEQGVRAGLLLCAHG